MEHPEPDTRDWTWVLDTECPECGFRAMDVDREELGALIRANAAAWRAVLDRGDIVTRRPRTADGSVVWSALEYGAHVRDVYEIFADRVELMLKKRNPGFANWNQDQTAIEKDYANDDPNAVAYALAVNAGRMADMFDRVSGKDWDRAGQRSNGSSFTVETIGLYLLHDPVHHLWDVEQGFEALTGS